MKTKNSEYIPMNSGSEYQEQSHRHSLNSNDQELYKEEDDIANTLVRVKRVSLPSKGVNWKIFVDNKNVEIIEGAKLSQKEKSFLNGVDGILFIMSYYKTGWKSFSNFKSELKKKIK